MICGHVFASYEYVYGKDEPATTMHSFGTKYVGMLTNFAMLYMRPRERRRVTEQCAWVVQEAVAVVRAHVPKIDALLMTCK